MGSDRFTVNLPTPLQSCFDARSAIASEARFAIVGLNDRRTQRIEPSLACCTPCCTCVRVRRRR